MPYFAIKSDDDVFDSVTPQAITARFVPESSVCCERGQKLPCRSQAGRLVALSAVQRNAHYSRLDNDNSKRQPAKIGDR